jgi:hypothetical protein
MHLVLDSAGLMVQQWQHVDRAVHATEQAQTLPCILGSRTLFFVLFERLRIDPAWPQKLWAAVSGHSRRPEVV